MFSISLLFVRPGSVISIVSKCKPLWVNLSKDVFCKYKKIHFISLCYEGVILGLLTNFFVAIFFPVVFTFPHQLTAGSGLVPSLPWLFHLSACLESKPVFQFFRGWEGGSWVYSNVFSLWGRAKACWVWVTSIFVLSSSSEYIILIAPSLKQTVEQALRLPQKIIPKFQVRCDLI